MKKTHSEPRKKGPTPGPPTNPYTVMLEPSFAEQGKHEPGGLSKLLRQLLQERYADRLTNST